MNDSYHENCILAIYTTVFDDTIGRDVINTASPVIARLYGHFQDVTQSSEGQVSGIHEMDRGIRFKFVAKMGSYTDFTLLRGGQFATIIGMKHPISRAYNAVNGGSQYVIKYVNQIHANQLWVSIGLENKNAT